MSVTRVDAGEVIIAQIRKTVGLESDEDDDDDDDEDADLPLSTGCTARRDIAVRPPLYTA